MFRNWKPGRARIVDVRAKSTTGDGMVTIHEYAADVTPDGGAPFRALIQEPTIATNFWGPAIGDEVMVLVDGRGQKVKFDKDDPRLNAKQRLHQGDASFQATLSQTAGAPGPTAGFRMAADPSAPTDPAIRLARLDTLKARHLVTDAEYADRRQAIIDEL